MSLTLTLTLTLTLSLTLSLYEVYGADEAFVTGTFGGLTPVSEIDGVLTLF